MNLLYIMYDIWGGNAFCWPVCNHYIIICNFVKRFFHFLFYLKYFCFLRISLGSSYWYFYLKKFCFSWLSNYIEVSKKSKRFFNLYTVVVYLLYILLYYIYNNYNIFIYRGFCLLSPIEYHDKYTITRFNSNKNDKNKQNEKIFKI